jgi:hypothetical protein
MLRLRYASLALLLLAAPASAAELPKPLAAGMKNPESVAVGPGGKVYVSVIGEFDKDGDGSVAVIEGGKPVTLVDGLDDPKGVAVFQNWLFVADKTKVLRVNLNAKPPKAEVFVDAKDFPTPPKFLNDIVANQDIAFGNALYVSDSGDLKGTGGAAYRITLPPPPKGKGAQPPKGAPKVDLVVDAKKLPGLHTPNGLAMDSAPARRRLRLRQPPPRQDRRRQQREDRRRDGRRRRRDVGLLRPALRFELEERQGVGHRPARREAGASRGGLQAGRRHVPERGRQDDPRAGHG